MPLTVLCTLAVLCSLLEGFLMRKGREQFHNILVQTPLWVITNEKVGVRAEGVVRD